MDSIFPEFLIEDRRLMEQLESQKEPRLKSECVPITKVTKTSHVTVDVVFELSPESSDKNTPSLSKQFIKTSGKLSVYTLKKYLQQKLNIPTEKISLTCNDLTLGSEHNLIFIKRTMWFDKTRDMIINYKVL